MNDYGEFIDPATIRFERLLPGPIEQVWDDLTMSDKRGEWLATGDMELREGGTVQLVFNHDRLTPHDDPTPEKYRAIAGETSMNGEIVSIEPPNLLSFTWPEEAGPDTLVTFDLTPQDDQVLLTLTHRHLAEDHEIRLGVAAGWHTHLAILADKLSDRVPEPFWAVHMELEEAYEKRLAEAA